MTAQRLHMIEAGVTVDYAALERACHEIIMGMAHGSVFTVGPVIDITSNSEPVRVEVCRLVVSPQGIRRAVLQTSNTWPLDNDPECVVASYYYVCEYASPRGWAVRQCMYHYSGDDRAIEWLDLLASA